MSNSSEMAWGAFVEVDRLDGTKRRHRIASRHTAIGRSPEVPITIDDDTVSRMHAEIFCDPFGRWWVRDLESMNGTSVNGERVAERVLSPGDCLRVGDVQMLFRIGFDADSTEQAPVDSSWVRSLGAKHHPSIEHDLERARQIQRALIPKSGIYAGVEVAVEFEASKWVGGDYVGAFTEPNGRAMLAVADVCGKGLQPALVTFSLHTMLAALSDSGCPLAEIMERLNEHLYSYMPEDSFVTMVAVSIDPAEGTVECVNAGHLPPLVLDKRGGWRDLQSAANPVLGVGRCEMVARRSRIEEGELLVLYTDGITELRDPSGSMLGEEQFARRVAETHRRSDGSPLAAIGRELTAMLDAYRGPETADDRAILLARHATRPNV